MHTLEKQRRRRTLADSLKKLLDAGVGERTGLHPFLKEYPQVLSTALAPYEHGLVRGITEFKFGNELKADFVLLTGFSGGFIVKMVELEPSTERMLCKDGSFRKRFNHALSQIHSWMEYSRHRTKGAALGLELERQFRDRELLAPYLKGQNPNDNTGKYPLSHPECSLWFQYAIVIGRRDALSEVENARKATLTEDQIEVVSWDRLLDAAKRFLPGGKPVPPSPYVTPPPTPAERALIRLLEK